MEAAIKAEGGRTKADVTGHGDDRDATHIYILRCVKAGRRERSTMPFPDC
jgi:hypothetical protein